MIGRFANALGYQLVWFVSVAGAGKGLPYAGPLIAIAFALMVLTFGGERRADLKLVAWAIAIGAVVDSTWIAVGWLDYNAAWPSATFAPAWILGLWASLALTLNHSLAFLRRRHLLTALLGAIGGPLSYWGAAHGLGAVRFLAPASIVLGGLCVAWAVLFLALMRMAEQPASAAPPVPSKSGEAHP